MSHFQTNDDVELTKRRENTPRYLYDRRHRYLTIPIHYPSLSNAVPISPDDPVSFNLNSQGVKLPNSETHLVEVIFQPPTIDHNYLVHVAKEVVGIAEPRFPRLPIITFHLFPRPVTIQTWRDSTRPSIPILQTQQSTPGRTVHPDLPSALIVDEKSNSPSPHSILDQGVISLHPAQQPK